ncbi:carbohydrate ABC transporter permease [Marisediminicola senii]|uniref:carbohydrate ABC transporter permease n=1 Tax=Marisediminicola senii TaxID=2711233 RepID=UPI0013ED1EA2|nr:sugar ABC transporter permease [Marisediminicola senii]
MTTSTVSARAVPTAGPATRTDTSGPARRRRSTNLTAYAFMAPFLVFFLLFLIWPVIHGVYLSMTDQSLTGAGGNFIGLANYAEAFADPRMWSSILNTLWFTLLSTVPLVVVALGMALLVQMGLPAQWLWRLSFFAPFLLASTVMSLIWAWLFNPSLGLINSILGSVGIAPVAWLQDPNVSMIAIVIATVWWTVGFNFLLYLAALQNIPDQQYEAAALDGAGKWRQLFSITIPQLKQTTILILILQVLASLKVFDQIYQMLQQAITPSTRSAVIYIFETGFTGYRFGYSSAISYIFFALIIIVALVQMRVTSRKGK